MVSPAADEAAPGRLVVRNTAAMLAAQVVSGVAGLVSLPIIFSHLGRHDFGIWIVLSGLATIVAFADLGLGSAVVRQVANTIHDGTVRRCRTTLGIALVWGLALAVIGFALLTFCWTWLASALNFGSSSGAAQTCALVLMLGLFADGTALPWRGVLQGTQRFDALSWINAGSAVMGSAMSVVVVYQGGGLVALAVVSAGAASARSLCFIGLARRYQPDLWPNLADIRRDDVRAVASYGLRVQVTSAAGAVNLEVDRFFLAGFFGPSVAGGFELGARIANLFRLVLVYALVALFPMAVTRTAVHGSEWLHEFNLIVSKYLALIAAIGAAALVACADPLVRLWLGESNWWASASIAILAPAYAVNVAAGGMGILSRVEGRPGRETGYALLSVAINLGLTWPLLQLLGPTGVPLATAVGVVVGTAWFMHSYYRVTARPLAPLLAAVIPSFVIASIAAALGVAVGSVLADVHTRLDAAGAVLTRGSVVILVAGAALVATRFVRREDVDRVRALVGRVRTLDRIAAGNAR